MPRTASFLIIIARSPDGYVASIPAIPDVIARASSARIVYARMKTLVKARILKLLANGSPVPRDPVIQTKQLRLDLWYLRQQEELQ